MEVSLYDSGVPASRDCSLAPCRGKVRFVNPSSHAEPTRPRRNATRICSATRSFRARTQSDQQRVRSTMDSVLLQRIFLILSYICEPNAFPVLAVWGLR